MKSGFRLLKIFNGARVSRSFTLGVGFDELSDEAVNRPEEIPRYNPRCCRPWQSPGHVVCSGVHRRQRVDLVFRMLVGKRSSYLGM